VSARPPEFWERTVKQLQDVGLEFDPKTQVFCVGSGDMYGSKIQMLKDNNVELMIDDAPHNVRECLDNGIDAILISNPETSHNHSVRDEFTHAPGLIEALESRGLI
jgi:hypothetical protein